MLAILAVLVAIAAWSHRDWLVLAPPESVATTRIAQPTVGGQVYFGPPHSVAVLPFNCIRYRLSDSGRPVSNTESEEGAPGPMADPVWAYGLAEELQGLLVKMSGIQVTALASSFFFAPATDADRVLSERLRVRHFLDGCVESDDKLLTLSVRLHDVRAGKNTWTETFSTPIDGLSGLMDELVRQTASRVRPGSEVHIPSFPDFDGPGWELLFQGRHFSRQNDSASLELAERAYRDVLQHDPANANAWLGLARLYLSPAWQGTGEIPGHERARQAALHALELDSGSAGAHLVLSRIYRFVDWDFEQSRDHAQSALERLQGDANILANAAINAFIFGQFDQAIKHQAEAVSRNPVVLNELLRLGLIHDFAGDHDQALIVYRQLIGLNPDYPAVYAYRARVKLAQDKPDSALAESEKELHPFWNRYARILSLDALERFEESDSLLDQMTRENGHDAAYQLAEIHAMRGAVDTAFEWLGRAQEQRDPGLSEILVNPFFANLHGDQRWSPLLTQLGLPGE